MQHQACLAWIGFFIAGWRDLLTRGGRGEERSDWSLQCLFISFSHPVSEDWHLSRMHCTAKWMTSLPPPPAALGAVHYFVCKCVFARRREYPRFPQGEGARTRTRTRFLTSVCSHQWESWHHYVHDFYKIKNHIGCPPVHIFLSFSIVNIYIYNIFIFEYKLKSKWKNHIQFLSKAQFVSVLTQHPWPCSLELFGRESGGWTVRESG